MGYFLEFGWAVVIFAGYFAVALLGWVMAIAFVVGVFLGTLFCCGRLVDLVAAFWRLVVWWCEEMTEKMCGSRR